MKQYLPNLQRAWCWCAWLQEDHKKHIDQGGLSPVLCIHQFAFRFCRTWKMSKRKPERSSNGGDSATKRKRTEDEEEEEGEEEDMEVANGMVCSCLLALMHMWLWTFAYYMFMTNDRYESCFSLTCHLWQHLVLKLSTECLSYNFKSLNLLCEIFRIVLWKYWVLYPCGWLINLVTVTCLPESKAIVSVTESVNHFL